MSTIRSQFPLLKNQSQRFGSLSGRTAVIVATLLALLIFLTTMQLDINGSSDPYVTDVGEIQNALPRWGTIHFTGYPQFTALGSAFVTILGLFGLNPAAGASLFSTLWGVISVGLLSYLAMMFGVQPWVSVVSSLLFAVSTSFWIDASIAEVHTMTIALTLATIIAAVRFGRSGSRRSLYWLAFLVGQGIAHQRAFLFLGLALLVFILPSWRKIVRHLPAVIGLFLIGPLTYIYLPIRAWQGAEWTFNAPGTWDGFWSIVFDNKAARIVEMPGTANTLWIRVRDVLDLVAQDWPWLLTVLGLIGLVATGGDISRRERGGLTLVWLPYLLFSVIIWIGRVGEAILAFKLPVVAMAALGLSFIGKSLLERSQLVGRVAVVVAIGLVVFLFFNIREDVLKITRDPGAQQTIETAERVSPASDGQMNTLMALEGNDYWQIAYAQEYKGLLTDINLVNHRRNFQSILDRGDHLLTFSRSFYSRPVAAWEDLLGRVYLSTVAPSIIEIDNEPNILSSSSRNPEMIDLENGIAILDASLSWEDDNSLILEMDWLALDDGRDDFSVAVHLVSKDPPTVPEEIVAQADQSHPVNGWYPTSMWISGEVVRDHYLLAVPPESNPLAVRVGMYQVSESGEFNNSPWLSLPVPSKN